MHTNLRRHAPRQLEEMGCTVTLRPQHHRLNEVIASQLSSRPTSAPAPGWPAGTSQSRRLLRFCTATTHGSNPRAMQPLVLQLSRTAVARKAATGLVSPPCLRSLKLVGPNPSLKRNANSAPRRPSSAGPCGPFCARCPARRAAGVRLALR